MDDKCDKIYCSIKNYLAKMFENDLIEGKVYVFSNFLIEESSGIYLPTTHVCRIIFKKESHVIGLLTEKRELISWSKIEKSGHYIVVDLHNFQYVKI
ncbi:hypothetical protein AHAS_Ahas19G0248000 [Arachis hypogaea]